MSHLTPEVKGLSESGGHQGRHGAGLTCSGTDLSSNPDSAGLSSLQILSESPPLPALHHSEEGGSHPTEAL